MASRQLFFQARLKFIFCVFAAVLLSPKEVALTKPYSGLEIGFAESKIKPAREAVPFGVVTLTLPVEPVPTTAVTVVELITLNDGATAPPKLTAVTKVRFSPKIVTIVPLPADVGVNELITGIGFSTVG
jgi:hypothetical protein